MQRVAAKSAEMFRPMLAACVSFAMDHFMELYSVVFPLTKFKFPYSLGFILSASVLIQQ